MAKKQPRKELKNQSFSDRRNRLEKGACPVHGRFMGQTEGWFYPPGKPAFTIVGCDDCEVRAKAFTVPTDPSYVVQLLPEWAHLLGEDALSQVLIADVEVPGPEWGAQVFTLDDGSILVAQTQILEDPGGGRRIVAALDERALVDAIRAALKGELPEP